MRKDPTLWERFAVALPTSAAIASRTVMRCTVPVALRLDFMPGTVWTVDGISQAPQLQKVFVPCDELIVVCQGGIFPQRGVTASTGPRPKINR